MREHREMRDCVPGTGCGDLMAKHISVTPSGVKYHIAKLRRAGIIRHVCPEPRAGRWGVLK